MSSKAKPYTDADTLQELHHDRGLTQQEIADKFGVSKDTITNYIKRHGIEQAHRCQECGREFDNAQSLRSHKSAHKDAPYKDAERIRELYHGKKMTAREVADELGCSTTTLRKWMDKLGVERRSHMEVIKNQWRLAPAEFVTGRKGYEKHRTNYEGGKLQVRHHRLIAVAIYGFEAVKGKEVHHKSGVEWDNRHDNLELLTPSEHSKLHAKEQFQDS